jgi:acyl carrier protein
MTTEIMTGNQSDAAGLAAVQATIAAVFAELLGNGEPVTAESDFFVMGGNSMLGARLVARLREACGVRVGIRDVFSGRTVTAIAAAVLAKQAAR